MNGMGMLLNSLGINPEEIQSAVTCAQTQLRKVDAAFQRIESKIDSILERLDSIEATIRNGEFRQVPTNVINERRLLNGSDSGNSSN